MFDLNTQSLQSLPSVGPRRAALLYKEIDASSVRDLLYYFPYKHIDRSHIYPINEACTGQMPYIQIKGTIRSFEEIGEGRYSRLVAHFTDGTGWVDLVWFKGLKYIKQHLRIDTPYIVFGKPNDYRGTTNIAHPDIQPADTPQAAPLGLRPYYSTTETMRRAMISSAVIEKMMREALQRLAQQPLPETLPAHIIAQHRLMPLNQALQNAHFPTDTHTLQQANFRLKFEELFYLQLNILLYARQRQLKTQGYTFAHIGQHFNNFYHNHLPFPLTEAQKRVLREIRRDVGSGRQMNRLLQGDVGSGKTLVALMAMLIAIDNGYQACLMAPTEILAQQHHNTLRQLLQGMPIDIQLLTGNIRGKQRQQILQQLSTGQTHILVGTHAVIEEPVDFATLGLIIIDEQHRFGVAQRAQLQQKSTHTPHVLVMTATPIPRTLAMTLYGDLDQSIIDQLPPGRKPIHTSHHYEYQRPQVLQFLHTQIQQGQQAYIVYPLIDESEKTDLKNLNDGFERLQQTFPHYNICKVHGKMKPAEKDAQMQLFISGQAQIMVATTVIEVGVNIPNASVMIIENAERFGLSQLHQLRGRVGRGTQQAYCILMTKANLADDSRKRIDIMTHTTDGFQIAEADLNLRGPGDPQGTRQSGLPFELKIANLVLDQQILQLARDAALQTLDNAQDPNNQIAFQQLHQLRKNLLNYGNIS